MLVNSLSCRCFLVFWLSIQIHKYNKNSKIEEIPPQKKFQFALQLCRDVFGNLPQKNPGQILWPWRNYSDFHRLMSCITQAMKLSCSYSLTYRTPFRKFRFIDSKGRRINLLCFLDKFFHCFIDFLCYEGNVPNSIHWMVMFIIPLCQNVSETPPLHPDFSGYDLFQGKTKIKRNQTQLFFQGIQAAFSLIRSTKTWNQILIWDKSMTYHLYAAEDTPANNYIIFLCSNHKNSCRFTFRIISKACWTWHNEDAQT